MTASIKAVDLAFGVSKFVDLKLEPTIFRGITARLTVRSARNMIGAPAGCDATSRMVFRELGYSIPSLLKKILLRISASRRIFVQLTTSM